MAKQVIFECDKCGDTERISDSRPLDWKLVCLTVTAGPQHVLEVCDSCAKAVVKEFNGPYPRDGKA